MLVALRGDAGVTLAHQYRPDAMVVDVGLAVGDGQPALEHLKQHPRHAPHPGARARRRHPAQRGAGRRRRRLPGPARSAREALAAALDDLAHVRRAPGRAACSSSTTTRPSGSRSSSCSAARTSRSTPWAPARRRSQVLERGPRRLPRARPAAARRQRVRRCSSGSRATQRFRDVPVIVHTGKALTRRDETRLRRYAETIVVKDAGLAGAAARSRRRCTCTASEARLPADKRKMLEQVQSADVVFPQRTALLVDDDVRNLFAIGSVLEARGMGVLFAENGREALDDARRPPRRRRRPARRDDAGDGRLRDDARDPRPASASPACRSSPSRRRP